MNIRDITVLLALSGSRAYGSNRVDSDVDIKGICIPPFKEYRLGALNKLEQFDSRTHFTNFLDLFNEEELAAIKLDCKTKGSEVIAPEGGIYDIKKFFSLARKANPNILECIWAPDENILISTSTGERIRENRELFLSKKVLYSYNGYAFSQMKRIKTHRSWLLNPPTKAPKRSDFGLPETHSLLSEGDQNAFIWVLVEILKEKAADTKLSNEAKEELENLNVFDAAKSGLPDKVWPIVQDITGATDDFISIVKAEKAYRAAKNSWRSYQSWKKNRNPKRAELERKFGFDCKHASHVVRLGIQGSEIVKKNKLSVRLCKEDRELVLDVLNGRWTYEELDEWFEKQQNILNQQAKESSLPNKPNANKIDELLIDIQEKFYRL